jgi:hypothetical protein
VGPSSCSHALQVPVQVWHQCCSPFIGDAIRHEKQVFKTFQFMQHGPQCCWRLQLHSHPVKENNWLGYVQGIWNCKAQTAFPTGYITPAAAYITSKASHASSLDTLLALDTMFTRLRHCLAALFCYRSRSRTYKRADGRFSVAQVIKRLMYGYNSMQV